MARRTLWLLLAGQLALAVLGVGLWRVLAASGPPAPVPVPPGAAGTPIADPVGLENGATVAWERARAWHPGSALLSATMQVDWPWEAPPPEVEAVPPTGWLTFVFVAPWDAGRARPEEAASLTVVIDRLGARVVAQTTSGWEEAPTLAPPPATPVVGSLAASLIAEEVGGTAFRRACPERRHLSRTSLVAAGTEGLPEHWVVTYPDTAQPVRQGLIVRIDAASAAVVGGGGEAPPCDDA